MTEADHRRDAGATRVLGLFCGFLTKRCTHRYYSALARSSRSCQNLRAASWWARTSPRWAGSSITSRRVRSWTQARKKRADRLLIRGSSPIWT